MRTIQGELKSLQDNQRLLAILVFSLVTVVIWVGFSLLNSQTKSSISPELRALAKPLNPTINTDVLDEIAAKREYTPDELTNFTIYSIKLSDAQKSIFSHQTDVVAPPAATTSAELSNPLNSLNNLVTTPVSTTSGTTTNSASGSGQTTGP